MTASHIAGGYPSGACGSEEEATTHGDKLIPFEGFNFLDFEVENMRNREPEKLRRSRSKEAEKLVLVRSSSWTKYMRVYTRIMHDNHHLQSTVARSVTL